MSLGHNLAPGTMPALAHVVVPSAFCKWGSLFVRKSFVAKAVLAVKTGVPNVALPTLDPRVRASTY